MRRRDAQVGPLWVQLLVVRLRHRSVFRLRLGRMRLVRGVWFGLSAGRSFRVGVTVAWLPSRVR